MARYTVDVKAFYSITVEAENEDDARRVADTFVENVMCAESATCDGYNEGLPSDAVGKIIPGDYGPDIDGESEVEDDYMHDAG